MRSPGCSVAAPATSNDTCTTVWPGYGPPSSPTRSTNMDDIVNVLDEAASHLRPYAFDTDALVEGARASRRRREGIYAASGALGIVAVVGMSLAGVRALDESSAGSTGGAAASRGTAAHATPAAVHSSTGVQPRPTSTSWPTPRLPGSVMD